MKNVNSFEEFINENIASVDEVKELMDKFGISKEEAIQVNDWIDGMFTYDDIDERMDFVEGLTIEFLIEDEDKAEEVSTYLKDLCIN